MADGLSKTATTPFLIFGFLMTAAFQMPHGHSVIFPKTRMIITISMMQARKILG